MKNVAHHIHHIPERNSPKYESLRKLPNFHKADVIYHVEEAVECYQPDDLPYEIIPKKEQIIGPDGKPVTVDDLYRAAELEISTVEDLCAIRTRYGSLEQFLKIDTLTEQKGTYHE